MLDAPRLRRRRRPRRRLHPDADAHAATAGCCAPGAPGSEPKLNAYLEDYAFLIDGLVSLYEATFAPRWIEAALDLAEVMIDQFWDAADGGFFFTGRDHEALIARGKDPHDNAMPSGNAMAVTALLRLVKLTGRMDLQRRRRRRCGCIAVCWQRIRWRRDRCSSRSTSTSARCRKSPSSAIRRPRTPAACCASSRQSVPAASSGGAEDAR